MVSELVFKFLDSMHSRRLHEIQESHKTARNLVQGELRGCVEFVNVNGRLYRYGVVSGDQHRTQQCVKALVPSLDEFNRVFKLDAKSWDEVSPFLIKNHLQSKVIREPHKLLPAPVLSMNASTLTWLKGVYVSLHRLNNEWGTRFKTWEDVVLDPESETQQNLLKDITRDDMAHLESMMKSMTQRAMASVNPSTDYRDVLECARDSATHGKVEMLFACTTKLHGRDATHMYMLMLLYLARSSESQTFSPLPPGKHHTHGADTRQFIDNYYRSDNDLRRDWGEGDPVRKIPLSSVASFSQFLRLVQSV